MDMFFVLIKELNSFVNGGSWYLLWKVCWALAGPESDTLDKSSHANVQRIYPCLLAGWVLSLSVALNVLCHGETRGWANQPSGASDRQAVSGLQHLSGSLPQPQSPALSAHLLREVTNIALSPSAGKPPNYPHFPQAKQYMNPNLCMPSATCSFSGLTKQVRRHTF